MVKEKFSQIYARASERKGGDAELESLLSVPLNAQEIKTIPDDGWVAAFSQKVFQCGISWKVVRSKWPNFEEVFFQFNIEKMLLMPADMWERKATDPAIIRHLAKVMTIPRSEERRVGKEGRSRWAP